MAALNLRQLKNWHAKGLRDFSADIKELDTAVRESFATAEIEEWDLLQEDRGYPVFGEIVKAATTAAVGVGGMAVIGWW